MVLILKRRTRQHDVDVLRCGVAVSCVLPLQPLLRDVDRLVLMVKEFQPAGFGRETDTSLCTKPIWGTTARSNSNVNGCLHDPLYEGMRAAARQVWTTSVHWW